LRYVRGTPSGNLPLLSANGSCTACDEMNMNSDDCTGEGGEEEEV
jgi:hypothetical protein